MEKEVVDAILNDSLLNWKDKGVLIAFVRWNEKGEEKSMMDMLSISSDGITAIRNSVNFLIQEGYVKRVYHGRGKKGAFVEYLVNKERLGV